MNVAPIVLFVYNRPNHTLKTLESLINNNLSEASTLFIYADGAKINSSESDKKNIKRTREIIREKQWCGEVHIIESEVNKGLADSIINGVSDIVNKYGKVIVLEDDLVLSPGFLKFMNDGLNFYEDTEEVMHISGFIYPINAENYISEETFFYQECTCWGWATWQRAWKYLETDPEILMNKIQLLPEGLNRFNIDGGNNYYSNLEENASGKRKTWAIKWQASMFIQNGLGLFPYKTLVNNIGNDGSGVHQAFTNKYINKNFAEYVNVKAIPLVASDIIRKQMHDYYFRNITKKSIIPIWLRKFIAKLIPMPLKKKIVSLWIK